MSAQLESLLPLSKQAQACAEDARQAAALKLHAEHFGHLGDRTPGLKASAIGDAARESADRLTLTLARGYAHHTTAADLLAALERDSQRMAARCTTVQYAGFQATVDAYLRALLRGQVLRLMGDATPPRDPSLTYSECIGADLGPVLVGMAGDEAREIWTTRPTNVINAMCVGDIEDLQAAARGRL